MNCSSKLTEPEEEVEGTPIYSQSVKSLDGNLLFVIDLQLVSKVGAVLWD